MQQIPHLDAAHLEQFVRDAQAGDTAAFGAIYDALYDRLYGYALKRTYDASASQDIVANSFYRILTHLPSFTWRDTARFYAWVFRIVMNEIATYYRKDGKYVLCEDWLEIADAPGDDESQLETMVRTERYEALYAAMATLPEKQQRIVELYYFGNLSHGEIAATLGIREGAARVRLHRAVSMLQTKLQGEEYAYRG